MIGPWRLHRAGRCCGGCAPASAGRSTSQPVLVEDPVFTADGEDAVLELLGLILHGAGPDDLLEAVAEACRRPGVAVPFLVVRLVHELMRDGVGELERRLQILALAAKAAR